MRKEGKLDKPEHSISVQSVVFSVFPEQSEPPLVASIIFDRCCVLVPPPHVAVHDDHSDHWPQTQLTGTYKE